MDIRVESLLDGASGAEGIVILIDVFGAGTLAALALARGAPYLALAATNEDADKMKRRRAGDLTIGDRGDRSGTVPDLGPAAGTLLRADLANRTPILSTRTLTMGFNAARHADRIFCMGLVNAGATARALRHLAPAAATLIPMGIDGRTRTDEDEVCAIYFKHLLAGAAIPAETATGFVKACVAAQRRQGHAVASLDKADLDIILDVNRIDFAVRVRRQDRILLAVRDPAGDPET